MIQIILGITIIAFIVYNIYTTNKLQAELVNKKAIIAVLQSQTEVLLIAKAELIRLLKETSIEVPIVKTDTNFSKKKSLTKSVKG